MKAALKKANMPDTPTARLILGKILAENADVEAEKKVALAEAYRCGYKEGMEAAAVICENVAGKYQHAHNASSENIADECAAAIRARTTP